MKLNKFIPILAIGATAATITPFVASCNSENLPPLPEEKTELAASWDDDHLRAGDNIEPNVQCRVTFDLGDWRTSLPKGFELEAHFGKGLTDLIYKDVWVNDEDHPLEVEWHRDKRYSSQLDTYYCTINNESDQLKASDKIIFRHAFKKQSGDDYEMIYTLTRPSL